MASTTPSVDFGQRTGSLSEQLSINGSVGHLQKENAKERHYSSGFSQSSFLIENFDETKFIDEYTRKIDKMLNQDFQNTINLTQQMLQENELKKKEATKNANIDASVLDSDLNDANNSSNAPKDATNGSNTEMKSKESVSKEDDAVITSTTTTTTTRTLGTDETEDTDQLGTLSNRFLTVNNLGRLQSDLNECSQDMKSELINLFEINYPLFLQLQESLSDNTEQSLKQMGKQFESVHKKILIIYQSLLRLLTKINQNIANKQTKINKCNSLKQVLLLPKLLNDIKSGLDTLHADFDPFASNSLNEPKDAKADTSTRSKNKSKSKSKSKDPKHSKTKSNESNNNSNNTSFLWSNAQSAGNPAIQEFMQQFRDKVSNASERQQYRLLQKACRLERIAIFLARAEAIFLQPCLNNLDLIKNSVGEFETLFKAFASELKSVFLLSIKQQSLAALRSTLRSFDYMEQPSNYFALRKDDVNASQSQITESTRELMQKVLNLTQQVELSPEGIVREYYIRPLVYKHLPLSIFANEASREYSSLSPTKLMRASDEEMEKKRSDANATQARADEIALRKRKILDCYDKLYLFVLKNCWILFHKEVMFNAIINNFARPGAGAADGADGADGTDGNVATLRHNFPGAVWSELVAILLSDDYKELFLSVGLPDYFHTNYFCTMGFFRKIQRFFYLPSKYSDFKRVIDGTIDNLTKRLNLARSASDGKDENALNALSAMEAIGVDELDDGGVVETTVFNYDFDVMLFNDETTRRFHKECNLMLYFQIRYSKFTKEYLQRMNTLQYQDLTLQYKQYLQYFDVMAGDDGNVNISSVSNPQVRDYVTRLENADAGLLRISEAFEQFEQLEGLVAKNMNGRDSMEAAGLDLRDLQYKYKFGMVQETILNLVKCVDANQIWLWPLSNEFLKLVVEMLAFLQQNVAQTLEQLNVNAILLDEEQPGVMIYHLLVSLHCDLFYFENWLRFEFVPFVKYQTVQPLKYKSGGKLKGELNENQMRLVNLIDRIVGPKLEAWHGMIRNTILREKLAQSLICASVLHLVSVETLVGSWQQHTNVQANDGLLKSPAGPQDAAPRREFHKDEVSPYVAKLFEPIQNVLAFMRQHSIEHLTVSSKNELLWNFLNGVSGAYWKKIKSEKAKLEDIHKTLETLRQRKQKAKTKSRMQNKRETMMKSGAEKVEYQLFCDVRAFLQTCSDYVISIDKEQNDYNALKRQQRQEREERERRDEKDNIEANTAKTKKNKSVTIVKRKHDSSEVVSKDDSEKSDISEVSYDVNNLACWQDLNQFVAQFDKK